MKFKESVKIHYNCQTYVTYLTYYVINVKAFRQYIENDETMYEYLTNYFITVKILANNETIWRARISILDRIILLCKYQKYLIWLSKYVSTLTFVFVEKNKNKTKVSSIKGGSWCFFKQTNAVCETKIPKETGLFGAFN